MNNPLLEFFNTPFSTAPFSLIKNKHFKSAFIKALHKRYNQEGIVIPFPITAINTAQEAANFNSDKN